MKHAHDQLAENGYCAAEIEKWIAEHPGNENPGALYSGLIYGCQIDGVMAFPRTIDFARDIDELSSRLYDARIADDLAGFKEKLMNSVVADPVYFAQNVEEMGLATPPMLELFQSAKDWNEIDVPFRAIGLNTLFSLLAHWDIEFSSQYFLSFTPRPCFSMVLPRIDPAAMNKDGTVSTRRDRFWLPVRRLINLMACIGEFGRSKSKQWPGSIPSVGKIITQVQLNGQSPEFSPDSTRDSESVQSLTNWRDGTKKFTQSDFSKLWQQLCPDKENTNEPNHPAEPWPLFVAALFWRHLLVVVSTASKQKSIFLMEEEYLEWWNHHHEDSKTNGVTFGSKPWPDCFNNV